MTTQTTHEALTDEAVLELISTRVEIGHWTTRMVLKELGIRDNNRNRKSCRGILARLSEHGKIHRDKLDEGSDLVTYRATAH